MNDLIDKNKMTSMEISEITGKLHHHIIRDIKDEIEKLEIAGISTETKFGLSERQDSTGRTIPYYELTKEGVLQLAARYDAVVRSKLIDLVTSQSQIDTSLLSPQMQVLISLELEQKKLQAEVTEVKQTLYLVKDTVANHPEDKWRETINKMMNKIVNAVGGKQFQEIRSNSYKLLEERAGINLNLRLDNLTERLRQAGASKSKISSANKLDIIEQDKKLREIYTGIVKELTIKHVA